MFKIKKKKALMSIETVIGSLIALVLLAVLLDLLILSNRYMSVHDTVKELSRTIAVQGGALEEKPTGYPNNYYNSIELAKLVDRSLKVGGIKNTDYNIYITYTDYEIDGSGKVTKDNTYKKDFMSVVNGKQTVQETDKIDYLHDFSVTIEAKYDWIFSKTFYVIDKAKLKSSAPGVSEWKYDYDKWESEE